MAAVGSPGPASPATQYPLDDNDQLVCKIEVSGSPEANFFQGTRFVNDAYILDSENKIGEGTYGQVFVGADRETQDKVALKMIRMDEDREKRITDCFQITSLREIKILSELEHENIVNLREIVRSEPTKENKYRSSVYMVFDYAEYDLAGLMDSVNHKLTEPQIKCIMKQILKGLYKCHSNRVIHRDLKLSNILVDNKGVVKLADFGLARTFVPNDFDKLTNRVITLWYRPPELLVGESKYGPEVDMWSAGCIFAELLTGRPLFPGHDEMEQIDLIFEVTGSPNDENWPGWKRLVSNNSTTACLVGLAKYPKNKLVEHIKLQAKRHGMPPPSDAAIKLLQKMLSLDPKKRISAREAVSDEYFWVEPRPCDSKDLPVKHSAHELSMKRKHEERKQAAAAQRAEEAASRDPKRQRTNQPQPHGGKQGGKFQQAPGGHFKPSGEPHGRHQGPHGGGGGYNKQGPSGGFTMAPPVGSYSMGPPPVYTSQQPGGAASHRNQYPMGAAGGHSYQTYPQGPGYGGPVNYNTNQGYANPPFGAPQQQQPKKPTGYGSQQTNKQVGYSNQPQSKSAGYNAQSSKPPGFGASQSSKPNPYTGPKPTNQAPKHHAPPAANPPQRPPPPSQQGAYPGAQRPNAKQPPPNFWGVQHPAPSAQQQPQRPGYAQQPPPQQQSRGGR